MAVEGFAVQAGSYGAEVVRRAAMGVPLLRGSSVGSVVGGLVGSTDLQTTAGSGMHVETSAGEIVIPQAYSTKGGPNYLINTATLTTAVPAASSEHPRVDLLVAQIEDAAYHGSANEYKIAYLTGTPTAGATLSNKTGAPSVPTSALALAYIEVPTSASSLTNGNIENVAGLLVPGLRSATYREGTAAERPAAAVKGRIYYATDTKVYSVDTGSAWAALTPSSAANATSGKYWEGDETKPLRGHSVIATEQSRENTAYGTLSTPDEVTVYLPEPGLILCAYRALWRCAATHQIDAALFIDGNQLDTAIATGPATQQAHRVAATATNWQVLSTFANGLVAPVSAEEYTGDATTGQIVGLGDAEGKVLVGASTEVTVPALVAGGFCVITAPAGTHVVSVQFRAPVAGAVAVKSRALYVEARPF